MKKGYTAKLKIFGFILFYLYTEIGFGFFRVFGYGLCWKDISVYPLSFSELNGYSKYFTVFKYRFTSLTDKGVKKIRP